MGRLGIPFGFAQGRLSTAHLLHFVKHMLRSGQVRRAAAYEVDYFQAVVFLQLGLGPAVSWNYFAVEFYGHAVGLHVEGFDQGRQGGRGVCEGAGFSVNVQCDQGEISFVKVS